jgi:hypothetical protein
MTLHRSPLGTLQDRIVRLRSLLERDLPDLIEDDSNPLLTRPVGFVFSQMKTKDKQEQMPLARVVGLRYAVVRATAAGHRR